MSGGPERPTRVPRVKVKWALNFSAARRPGFLGLDPSASAGVMGAESGGQLLYAQFGGPFKPDAQFLRRRSPRQSAHLPHLSWTESFGAVRCVHH
jgi:hypothetical protein